MGIGNYNQREYERRERSIVEIESDSDDQPDEYRGTMAFDD